MILSILNSCGALYTVDVFEVVVVPPVVTVLPEESVVVESSVISGVAQSIIYE